MNAKVDIISGTKPVERLLILFQIYPGTPMKEAKLARRLCSDSPLATYASALVNSRRTQGTSPKIGGLSIFSGKSW